MESRNRNVSHLWKTLLRKWRESKEVTTRRKSDVSTATSFLMRLASMKKKGQNKRELQRAKTMPTISVTSVLSAEELLQQGIHINTTPSQSGSSASAASSSSSSSSSSKSGKHFMRKMSYPESYFRWLTQRRSSSSPTAADTSAGTKSKKNVRPRSQSEHRLWKTRRKSDSVRRASTAMLQQERKSPELQRTRSWRFRRATTTLFSRGSFRKESPTEDYTPQFPKSAWSFEEGRRYSSGLLDETHSTSQLFYTTPPKSDLNAACVYIPKIRSICTDRWFLACQADTLVRFYRENNMVRSASNEKRLETSSSAGNLQKLSRRLVSRDKKDPLSPSRNRSISLDWGDAHALKLFSSSSEESAMDVMSGLSVSPSAPAYLSFKEEQSYSPKIRRDLKLLTNSQKKKSTSVDSSDGQTLSKRKSDKEKRALFDAVEQQNLDLTKAILDSLPVDINSLNAENLTALDIAVMTNNIPMAKMLLSKGAKESPIFQKGECRNHRLESLVTEAEKRVIDLTATVLNASSGNANISPAQHRENEKQLAHWEFRHRLLKRIKTGYEHAKPPESPTNVKLEVTSNSSLLISFSEPQSHNGAVVTKYKVEWSTHESFMPLTGETVIEDLSRLQLEIKNLTKGKAYFVRVCAWNMKGYGSYCSSEPLSAVPSSWRDVEDVPSRLDGKIASLYMLYHQVKRSRPPDTAEMKDILNKGTESPMQKKRISIKNLFLSAPKFQKTIKRGVYMACLFYYEDKILVTSEEQLPIIEVDETFSGPSIQTDLYWLLKISCVWEDVKVLKQDMEKTSSAGSTFRCKLLQAIISLQNGLGIQDLGQFFHRPVRDNNNSIIFTVVNQIRDPKLVTLGSSKWVTFGKLARRQSLSTVDTTDAHSLLVSVVPEMILYHQVSGICLPRGLYLGYVKLQASVEVLRVMVPNRTPNCVPHVKIRDCPNVSKEEWEWLLKYDSHNSNDIMSVSQKNFHHLLADATKKLFTQLDLSEDTIASHRLYDLEVLELSHSVTMILILPSIEDICIIPGHTDSLAKRADFSFLPVQIFESIHMHAYLPEFFSLYARLSAIVEMDGVLAQQGHREAFSTEELSKAKEQVEVTTHLQQNLDRIWKCARWIRDITTYARNREKKAGIHLSQLLKNTALFNNNSTAMVHDNKLSTSRINNVADSNSNHLSISSTLCLHNAMPRSILIGNDHKQSADFCDITLENPYNSFNINSDGASMNLRDNETETVKATSSVLSNSLHPNISQTQVSPSFSLSLSASPSNTVPTESIQPQDSSYAIIKVHAMYDTGLNKNVNIKLHITEQTTSRDIINLVVRHLNTIIQNKGKDLFVYSEESLASFCLVLKFQGHKKILKDDYRLLQLKGQLQRAKVYITMLDTVFLEDKLEQASVV